MDHRDGLDASKNKHIMLLRCTSYSGFSINDAALNYSLLLRPVADWAATRKETTVQPVWLSVIEKNYSGVHFDLDRVNRKWFIVLVLP